MIVRTAELKRSHNIKKKMKEKKLKKSFILIISEGL